MISKESLDYMYGVAICGSGLGETADKVRECYNKIADDLEILENYKKIEKKVGLSIATILKVLEEGIYKGKINVYGDYDKTFCIRFRRRIGVDLIKKEFFEYSDITGLPNYPVKFKDYGKTWWLKEDKEKLNSLFNYEKDSIGDYWK